MLDLLLVYRVLVYFVSLLSVHYEPLVILLDSIFKYTGHSSEFVVLRFLLFHVYILVLDFIVCLKNLRRMRVDHFVRVRNSINICILILNIITFAVVGIPALFKVYSIVLIQPILTHLFTEIIPRYGDYGRFRRQDSEGLQPLV